jgi:2-polyprenyl-3-methyl-5-hydroxy-6-metoxy-1,4-benzoquinol methylase
MSRNSETVSCPLCSSAKSEPLVVGYDRMRAMERDFPYVVCQDCGLVRQDPMPREEDIPGFYPDDYGPHMGGLKKKRDKWINRLARRYYYETASVGRSGFMRFLFKLLSKRVMPTMRPPRGKNRLLDIGCASGDLMSRYRDLGWSVQGIEISPRACEVARAKGLEVHQGTAYSATYPAGSFDMIILSHVIEHVLEPDKFLLRCAEFLAPGGVLVLSTPCIRSFGFSQYRSCWFALDAPRHLMLFDQRTIRLLGQKAGLRSAKIITHAEPHLLCESRHYLRSQGAKMPAEFEKRRELVEASIKNKEEYRLYRRLVSPLASVNALLGRGEVMEADFVHSEAT